MDNHEKIEIPIISKDIRLGLALSGGGFRASLYHIGVLAALAERGILPYVQVISGVSGGSIIAAFYYLYLKNLLESKLDSEITQHDYIALVQNMEDYFVRVVQTNIRLRVFTNPVKLAEMLILPNYSRTDRIGELLDMHLYRPVFRNVAGILIGQNPRMKDAPDERVQMRHIKIRPLEMVGGRQQNNEEFHPGRNEGNDSRRNKVPDLIINCTTLNTGRNWRFTSGTLGEQPPRPGTAEEDVDRTMRLERPVSYDETKFRKNFPLGKAVAASAAVPGIFQPFPVSRLYHDKNGNEFLIQLSDGGVYDNQGIEALMDEQPVLRNRNCSHLLVSDASGQLNDDLNPSTGIFNVVSRTNEILMKRVREEELLRLINDQNPIRLVERAVLNLSPDCTGSDNILKEAGKILKPAVFLHLRRNVPVDSYQYIGEKNVSPSSYMSARNIGFGVHPEAQSLLSHVRTDLDTFTDVEVFSLAADGYLMAERYLPKAGSPEWKEWDFLPRQAAVPDVSNKVRWKFAWAFDRLKEQPQGTYKKQLKASGEQLGKVFILRPFLSSLIALPILAAITLLLYLLLRSVPIPVENAIAVLTTIGKYSFGEAVASLIGALLACLLLFLLLRRLLPVLKRVWNWLNWIRVPLTSLWLNVIGPVLGSLFVSSLANLYLVTLDRLYLVQGRVKRGDETEN